MNSREYAAELRRQAEQVERLAELAESMEDKLDAYRDDPSDENRAAYKAAALELTDARRIGRPKTTKVGGDAVMTGVDEEPPDETPEV